MKIGILAKRTRLISGDIKKFLEEKGHEVTIFTEKNLCINESLLEFDFFILKSKKLFFIYAGYYLEVNDIPVIPSTSITHKHKYRPDAYNLIKDVGFNIPDYYMGSPETLIEQLKDEDYPFIMKSLMGSGSRGVKLIKSKEEIPQKEDEIIYLEDFIKGIHYNVYFIEDEICTLIKPALSTEHVPMDLIQTPDDIREIILRWRKKYSLLFGHLDMVRENNTNKLYVVDPGTFPVYSNWKCKSDPVSKICNIILNEAKKSL